LNSFQEKIESSRKDLIGNLREQFVTLIESDPDWNKPESNEFQQKFIHARNEFQMPVVAQFANLHFQTYKNSKELTELNNKLSLLQEGQAYNNLFSLFSKLSVNEINSSQTENPISKKEVEAQEISEENQTQGSGLLQQGEIAVANQAPSVAEVTGPQDEHVVLQALINNVQTTSIQDRIDDSRTKLVVGLGE
jgi:hypothetical protein